MYSSFLLPLLAGFVLTSVAPFGDALDMNPEAVGLAPSTVFVVSRSVNGVGTALTLVGGYATITTQSDSWVRFPVPRRGDCRTFGWFHTRS